MKKLSAFISYAFHPVFVATYLSAFIIQVNPYHFSNIAGKQFFAVLLLIFGLTTLYPLFAMVVMYWLKLIKSAKMESAKERFIPLIAISTFYLWTYFMLKPGGKTMFSHHELLSNMILGGVVSLFIAMATTSFQKISLHMIGAGAMLGCVLNIIPHSPYNLVYLFIAVAVLGGVIGSARLMLGAHTIRQVLLGFFVGFFGQFCSYQLISKL